MRLLVPVVLLLAGCGAEPPNNEAAAPVKPQPAPDIYKVKLETSKGDILVEVHKEWAPRAAERFYELVHAKYYNEARFYRVIHNFIAQFGIHKNPEQNRLWRWCEELDHSAEQTTHTR